MSAAKRCVEGVSRRVFIKDAAAVVAAAGLGDVGILKAWSGEGGLVLGMEPARLAALKTEQLQDVMFTALAAHPVLERKDVEGWEKVMSAVFPEGAEDLRQKGWVKHEAGGDVFVCEEAKLRLAAAYLFSVRGGYLGGSLSAVELYTDFLTKVPLEEAYVPGKSPEWLVSSFFGNGGSAALVNGSKESMEGLAGAWEEDNGVRLRGGSTAEGLSVLISIQEARLSFADAGAVKVGLMKREAQPRDIVPHGKGVVDVAMMREAVKARLEPAEGGHGGFYANLKAELKPDAKLSSRIDTLQEAAGKGDIPGDALRRAVVEIAAESLTAKAYPGDAAFINRFNSITLYMESPLLSPSQDVEYPGYTRRPRTKATAAAEAVSAVKGAVVAYSMGYSEIDVKYRKLSASFVGESEVRDYALSAAEDVFKGVFDAFRGRRAEMLESLRRLQDAPGTESAARRVSDGRKAYLADIAPLRKSDFVGSAFDAVVKMKKALGERI